MWLSSVLYHFLIVSPNSPNSRRKALKTSNFLFNITNSPSPYNQSQNFNTSVLLDIFKTKHLSAPFGFIDDEMPILSNIFCTGSNNENEDVKLTFCQILFLSFLLPHVMQPSPSKNPKTKYLIKSCLTIGKFRYSFFLLPIN